MEIASKQKNLEQLDEKIQKERLDRQLETQEKLGHIEYLTNHDFYTENTDTCKSYLGKNRYLPYHWKGMSEEERQRILEEQAKQIQEKKMQKEIEKDTGIRFGIVEQHQFAAIAVTGADGHAAPLGMEQSKALWEHLKVAGHIDAKGNVQESLKKALTIGTLELPA